MRTTRRFAAETRWIAVRIPAAIKFAVVGICVVALIVASDPKYLYRSRSIISILTLTGIVSLCVFSYSRTLNWTGSFVRIAILSMVWCVTVETDLAVRSRFAVTRAMFDDTAEKAASSDLPYRATRWLGTYYIRHVVESWMDIYFFRTRDFKSGFLYTPADDDPFDHELSDKRTVRHGRLAEHWWWFSSDRDLVFPPL